ncbi:MAG: hypothetical protein KY453_07920 [Gemmatimonadetes bacterium]|nr:hypothetical protein [Gemmatimonadota bacterium]
MAALLAPLAAGACGGGQAELPAPRPIIVHSGERLHADPDSMEEVHRWLTSTIEVIEEDPSFWIIGEPAARSAYVWESVHIVTPDSVRVEYERTHPDALTSHQVYAFLHIMDRQGRLLDFVPEAPVGDTYGVEKAILERVADTWLLGRAVFATSPYDPLDHLMYSAENGWLDALILTARPDEFEDRREAWLRENPGGPEAFRQWFRDTFDQEPPGVEETPGE